jgi:hypothetical protein
LIYLLGSRDLPKVSRKLQNLLKIIHGLVPTNDFLVVVSMTFVSWEILLIFKVLAIAQRSKRSQTLEIRKRKEDRSSRKLQNLLKIMR